MTPEDKREFITSLCNSVRDELLGKVDKMPEEWNGIELRRLIAEKFSYEQANKRLWNRKRVQDYNSAIYNENL